MMILDWKRFLLPYEQAVEELKVKFKSIRSEYRKMGQYSPIEFVTGRVKAMSSIVEKSERRNIPLERIEEMEDIAGIRIMCQLVDDIEKVVTLIRDRDGKDLKIVYEKDYIENIKESGYRSYHIIVSYKVQTAIGEKEILAEIQVRTLAMNFWATIEHSLNYKFNEQIPEDIKMRLKNSAEAAFLLDKEMSEIKDEIIDSQGMFQQRSSIIADILYKIQDLYSLNISRDDLENIENEFWKVKSKKDHSEIEEFKNKLDVMIKNKKS